MPGTGLGRVRRTTSVARTSRSCSPAPRPFRAGWAAPSGRGSSAVLRMRMSVRRCMQLPAATPCSLTSRGSIASR